MNDKSFKCHYCYFSSPDIEEIKSHEEDLHGCFRDINPRNPDSKKPKPYIIDKVWYARDLQINGDFKIDVLHELYSDGSCRMYTDDLKYGNHLEIIWDENKQQVSIKGIGKLRKKWKEHHTRNIVTDVKPLKEFVDEMS